MRTRSAWTWLRWRSRWSRTYSRARSIRLRSPSPIPSSSRMPSVVTATRPGVHAPNGGSMAIVRATTQAIEVETQAQTRAPRTIAPTRANARAT